MRYSAGMAQHYIVQSGLGNVLSSHVKCSAVKVMSGSVQYGLGKVE